MTSFFYRVFKKMKDSSWDKDVSEKPTGKKYQKCFWSGIHQKFIIWSKPHNVDATKKFKKSM